MTKWRNGVQTGLAVLLAVVVAFSTLTAQAPVPRYRILVSVTDSRGAIVPGLSAGDFTVRVGDVSTPALVAEVDTRPVSAVVIVDGVESQEALYVRSALNDVLKRFRQVQPAARLALMLGVGGASQPVLEDAVETSDAHSRQVAKFFRAEQTAPPQDTMLAAAHALAREEDRRKVILMISVNRRAEIVRIPESLATMLHRHDILVGTIEVATAVPPATQAAGGSVMRGTGQDQVLFMIYDALGGGYNRVPDVTALSIAAPRMASSLLAAYRVTFETQETGSRPISVEVRGAKRAVVIAPKWVQRIGDR